MVTVFDLSRFFGEGCCCILSSKHGSATFHDFWKSRAKNNSSVENKLDFVNRLVARGGLMVLIFLNHLAIFSQNHSTAHELYLKAQEQFDQQAYPEALDSYIQALEQREREHNIESVVYRSTNTAYINGSTSKYLRAYELNQREIHQSRSLLIVILSLAVTAACLVIFYFWKRITSLKQELKADDLVKQLHEGKLHFIIRCLGLVKPQLERVGEEVMENKRVDAVLSISEAQLILEEIEAEIAKR